MSTWRHEYLASIRDAEQSGPVNRELVQACSQLQDRVAVLEADKAHRAGAAADDTSAAVPDPVATVPGPGPDPGPATSGRAKLDLAEALRSNGALQARLRAAEEQLRFLRGKTAADGRAIRALTAERNALATKVRDRDEEIREKQKLVENVQDELIALNLQLNVSEQQNARVKAENEELVERWMRRMGQEADAMNQANEPLLRKPT